MSYRPKIKVDSSGTLSDLAIDAATVDGHAVENTGVSSNTGTLATTAQVKSYTDTAVQNAIEIAQGKTKNYVISYQETGTNVVNSYFNSTSSTISLNISSNKLVDVNLSNINLSSLKIGDIVSVIETNVPDRWVGSISSTTIVFYPLETKLDIDPTIVQNSTNPVAGGAVYDAFINVVYDANYVHTDNNYTTNEKNKLANMSSETWTFTVEVENNGVTSTTTVTKKVYLDTSN